MVSVITYFLFFVEKHSQPESYIQVHQNTIIDEMFAHKNHPILLCHFKKQFFTG